MPEGGCFCGKVRYSIEGEPLGKVRSVHPNTPLPFPSLTQSYPHNPQNPHTNLLTTYQTNTPPSQALCHCLDCRKITGSTYSTNIIVAGPNFKLLSGTPKSIAKTADSGKEIVSHFCGDCWSTLFRDGVSFGDGKVVKVGTLDDIDALGQALPAVELFASHRVKWVGEVPGAAQKVAM